jgi:hypothetical protein
MHRHLPNRRPSIAGGALRQLARRCLPIVFRVALRLMLRVEGHGLISMTDQPADALPLPLPHPLAGITRRALEKPPEPNKITVVATCLRRKYLATFFASVRALFESDSSTKESPPLPSPSLCVVSASHNCELLRVEERDSRKKSVGRNRFDPNGILRPGNGAPHWPSVSFPSLLRCTDGVHSGRSGSRKDYALAGT